MIVIDIVKILGVPYSVQAIEDWRMVQHGPDDGPLWGQISYRDCSIRYKSSCPENELRIILHEIIHGIIELGGIRELKDEKNVHLEEPIIQLANGISEALESVGIRNLFSFIEKEL